MSGFGSGGYGTADYGLGDDGGSPPITATLLVQADANLAESECVISGMGTPIVDTSRNDSFPGPSIDESKWIVSSTGLTLITFNNLGLNVNLIDGTTSPSYTLTAVNQSISADISVDYDIGSNPNISPISHQVVFAALQYWIDDSNYLAIKRVLSPGFNGQQIYVSYVIDDVQISMASITTTDTSGTLRLINQAGALWAIYNGAILYHNPGGFTGTGLVRILTDSGGSASPILTRLSNFTSDTGILFGDTAMLYRETQVNDKVSGQVPQSSQIGFVDMTAFNHNGIVGTSHDGFQYLLVTGTPLSTNNGIAATIQTDPVLRG